MKKIILGIFLISNIMLADGFAQVGLGYSRGNNDGDIATGFVGAKVLSNIGLRLEYTKNISEHPEFSKEDISRYGLFATYTLPLTSSFSITPKMGVLKTDGEFQVQDAIDTISDSSTEFTYGLELNYSYNELVSFFVGYTDYGNKLDIKSIDTSKMDTQNYTIGIKIDM